MIEHVWFYALVPLLSATFCLVLLKKLITNKAEYPYIILFANWAVLDLFLASGYLILLINNTIFRYSADAYLISLYFLFTNLLLFAINLSIKKLTPKIQLAFYIVPAILTIFHICGWMIEDFRIEHNTLMHNDGPLAFIFDFYILLSSIAVYQTFKKRSKDKTLPRLLRAKNLLARIAFFPLIAMFIIIILLSMTQWAFPTVLVIPIISVYTTLIYYYISRDRIIDLSMGLDFIVSRSRVAIKLLETEASKTGLKDHYSDVEKVFIEEALEKNDNNVKAAAKSLGYEYTTINKKLSKIEKDRETGKLVPNKNE